MVISSYQNESILKSLTIPPMNWLDEVKWDAQGLVPAIAQEAATGDVLFASWHLGSLGTPIAACHAGGILGALVTWLVLREPNRDRPSDAQASIDRKPARFRLTTPQPFAGMAFQSHANSSIATARRVGPDGKPAGG